MDKSIKCKVRVISPLNGVFSELQPVIGAVYDASYKNSTTKKNGCGNAAICVIQVRGKSICLRPGEYEILEVE